MLACFTIVRNNHAYIFTKRSLIKPDTIETYKALRGFLSDHLVLAIAVINVRTKSKIVF